MIETPLTKPSKPSIRFIALVIAIIQKTVKKKVTTELNSNSGPPNGILKLSKRKSVNAQTITAPRIIPSIFVLGFNS